MTTPNTTENEAPIIPPALFLGITLVSLVAALLAFALGAEAVITIGALVFGLISLVAWVIFNPQEALNFIRGRGVSYGGTAIVVTALAIVASGVLYALVAAQNIQRDLSGTDFFSLNPGVRAVIETLAADPTTPEVRIVGFYTLQEADVRDQIELLLRDFDQAGGDKVSFEFIDPNRAPLAQQNFGVQPGQLAVARVDENGEAIAEGAEVVNDAGEQTQFLLAEAIITQTATGDFRAYFLNLEDGVSIDDQTGGGAAILANELRERFRWTVEPINASTLVSAMQSGETNEDGDVSVELGGAIGTIDENIELLDAAADGEVIVIPGGGAPLPDDVVNALQAYTEAGGDLVVFAAQSNSAEDPALATAQNFRDFLNDTYAVSVNDDIMLDARFINQVGQLGVQGVEWGTHPIVETIAGDDTLMTFTVPRTLEIINPNATTLISTDAQVYAKDELDLSQELTMEALQQTPDDVTGPLELAVAVEADTGSRLVLFSGTEPLLNGGLQFLNLGVANFEVARNALFWATDFENVAGNLANIPTVSNPGEQPLNFTGNLAAVNTASLFAIFVLPFGVLAVGIAVWWLRRETVNA